MTGFFFFFALSWGILMNFSVRGYFGKTHFGDWAKYLILARTIWRFLSEFANFVRISSLNGGLRVLFEILAFFGIKAYFWKVQNNILDMTLITFNHNFFNGGFSTSTFDIDCSVLEYTFFYKNSLLWLRDKYS